MPVAPSYPHPPRSDLHPHSNMRRSNSFTMRISCEETNIVIDRSRNWLIDLMRTGLPGCRCSVDRGETGDHLPYDYQTSETKESASCEADSLSFNYRLIYGMPKRTCELSGAHLFSYTGKTYRVDSAPAGMPIVSL